MKALLLDREPQRPAIQLMKSVPREQRLFAEIGHHLARILHTWCSNDEPKKPKILNNASDPELDAAFQLLTEFGIFAAVSTNNWQFLVKPRDIRSHLSDTYCHAGERLAELNARFLWVAVHRDVDLSDDELPFETSPALSRLMEMYGELGYAIRHPHGYVWADKIHADMKKAGLWHDSADTTITTAHRLEAFKLAEDIWKVIPKAQRSYLTRWLKDKNEMDLYVYLCRRWTGSSIALFELASEDRLSWLQLPVRFAHAAKLIAHRLTIQY